MPIKVLLMENVHDVAAEAFKNEGFEVVRHTKLSPEDFEKQLADTNIIGIRSKTMLPKEMLDKAPNLMCIGCFCIGTDTIDLPVATKKGIPVFNSPYANSRSVAELIISKMVMLARQTGDRSMEMHKGIWNKKSQGCYEVRGKTLGIVGYGHVGSQLSVLAEAMGMKVLFCDIVNKLALGTAMQVTKEELLKDSDFVSMHVPRLKSTEDLIAADDIALMKKGSYILNASRGKVVNVDATAAALKSGHLAGAYFDVYPSEPKGYTEDFKSVLQGCPNTVLTPHIGGSTEEAQHAIGVEVSTKLINFVERGPTMGSVNVPQVDIGGPLEPGFTRIMNFHHDVPGVMRSINEIVSIGNVTYQTLRTGGGVGYVIVDLTAEDVSSVKDALEGMKHSIKTFLIHQGPGYKGEH